MNDVEPRRIVPIAFLALLLFIFMALFQVFVIAGGFEIKASAVKKIMPVAYESFLRLVGEHPETRPEWSAAAQATKSDSASSAVTFAGFDPKTIPVTIEEDEKPATKVLIEPSRPKATEKADEPAKDPSNVVPVG